MKAAETKNSFKMRRLRFGLGLKDGRDPSKREAGAAHMNKAKPSE